MNDIIKTVGVLVFHDNKVLLVCHGEKAGHLSDTYGIPAGRLEKGELLIEAARRELFEETGLETVGENLIKLPTEYSASIERKDGTKKNYSQNNFLCINWNGNLKDSDETTPEWVDIEELDKLKLLPNVKKMILDGLSLKRNSM